MPMPKPFYCLSDRPNWLTAASMSFVLSLAVLGQTNLPARAHSQSPVGPCIGPVLQTNGRSEMTVSPDSFRVNATIQTQAKTTVLAMQQANQTMASLKHQLTRLGIDDLLLKTTQYHTHPVYPPYNKSRSLSKRQPIGYQHRQTLQISLEGITESAKLTQAANRVLGAMGGINHVQPGQLQWSLSSGSPYEMELLKAAVEQAKKRANVMATAAGAQLGDVCEITYRPSHRYAQPVMAMARSMSMDAEAMPAPKVEAGEQQLSTQVSVRYQLKPGL